MRGRDTKIQASPDRCRLYATLNRTSEHLYCFRVWEASGVVWETRSGYLPLETVKCRDHERVDLRDISIASPYSLTGSGECKTAASTSAVSPLPAMQL
jgi:hypothetical protein